MRFHESIELHGSLAEVRQLLADTSFREEVARASGAEQVAVTITQAGTDELVVIDSHQPTQGWPTMATAVLGDDLRIRQEERWAADAGTLSVTIPGKPGTVVGTLGLEDRDGVTRQTVEADITVKVPFVGGKVEGLIGNVLSHVLSLQSRVGNERLAR